MTLHAVLLLTLTSLPTLNFSYLIIFKKWMQFWRIQSKTKHILPSSLCRTTPFLYKIPNQSARVLRTQTLTSTINLSPTYIIFYDLELNLSLLGRRDSGCSFKIHTYKVVCLFFLLVQTPYTHYPSFKNLLLFCEVVKE